MTRRAYLHVGAGKTGTSALQAELPRFRDRLLNHGVYYPEDITQSEVQAKLGQVSSGNALTLARLSNRNLPRATNWRSDEAIVWLEGCLSKAAQNEYDLLFSNEQLQFADPDQFSNLLKYFAEFDFEVKVIFYLRTAIDYSISAYLQRLKIGSFPTGKRMDLCEYLRNDKVPFGRTIKSYEASVGASNIDVRNYDLFRKNLVPSFIAQFIPDLVDYKPQTILVNRSLTSLEKSAFEALSSLPKGNHYCRILGAELVKLPPSGDHASPCFVDELTLGQYVTNNQPIIDRINSLYLSNETKVHVSSIHQDALLRTNDTSFNEDELHSLYCHIIGILDAKSKLASTS